MDIDSVGEWVLVTGAVGTAAMGLVEAAKAVTIGGRSLSTYGLGFVLHTIGPVARSALVTVYGAPPRRGESRDASATPVRTRTRREIDAATRALLEGSWRRGAEELERVVRDGLRMALLRDDADVDRLAEVFGDAGPPPFHEAVRLLRSEALRRDDVAGGEAAAAARTAVELARERVARVESAIDARVRAAVAGARDRYAHAMQVLASVVALGGTMIVWTTMRGPSTFSLTEAVLVGILAVPIAPVAKDVVGFLNALRTHFAARTAR